MNIAVGNRLSVFGHGGSSGPNGVPANLVLTVIDANTLRANFDSTSTNQDGYRVYAGTDGITFPLTFEGTASPIDLTGLTEGTQYYAYVVAYKKNKESDHSNTASNFPYSWSTRYPSDLFLTVISGTQIRANWTNNGIKDYDYVSIERNDNGGAYSELIQKPVGTIVLENTGLTAGHTYGYRLRYSKGGTFSAYSNTVTDTAEVWYLRGGIPAANCVAAYSPLGAASLAASYVNLANPGTYDLTLGKAPVFDSQKGWTFDSSNAYLKTGITVAAGWSAIVKFKDGTDLGAGNNHCVFGAYTSGTQIFAVTNCTDTSPRKTQYGNVGGALAITGTTLTGTVGFANHKAYKDGVQQSGTLPTGTAPTHQVYIGCLNVAGTAGQFFRGTIEYIAFYNIDVSAQMAGLDSRMKIVLFPNQWAPQGTVLSATEASEEDNIFEPTIMRETGAQILSGTVFKMWHSGGWSNPNIYYAESIDGVSWTKRATQVVSGMLRNYVVKHNGLYYLYCANLQATHVDLYTSVNGVDFTLHTANILTPGSAGAWDANGIANSSILIENGVWYMFYDGIKTGTAWKTGLANSNDGITWTKYGSNPVISDTGCRGGCYIQKIGSNYYIWLISSTTTSSLPSDIGTRYKSTDLYNWSVDTIRNCFNRLGVDEGAGTSVGQCADPFLIEYNNQVMLYYAASSDGSAQAGHQHIKLAIANMPISELVLTQEGRII